MRDHPAPTGRRRTFTPIAEAEVEQSIPGRFAAQVARHGDRLVVKSAREQHTYTELDSWSNRIARTLLDRRGSGAEPVIVCFENGAAHLASLLGVLKAGKFYVVVDATMPTARMRYILEDSGAALVLTDAEHLDVVRRIGLDADQVVDVEALDDGLSGEDPGVDTGPDDLAYILYTSGSTGRPKGVMQTHRYVLNLVRVYSNSGLIDAEDRFALLSSPIFAGAVRDTYCALLNGATLYPFRAKSEGLANLAAWLMDEEITLLFMVPTAFRHFCHMLSGEERFPRLRQLLLVSEAIYKRDFDLFKRHMPDDCVLAATLGSSELSPVCQYFMDKSSEMPGSAVPVGYAPDHAEITLVGEDGEPVPEGEVGEIVVRSRYLSPGYWQRPEINARVYADEPDGRRVLHLGDLGRMTADGCVTHAGRKDFQVQIRGYRVETGEVETAILETGLARETVVMALPDHAGELQLVAYVVPEDAKAPPELRGLRNRIAETLPDYMLPANLVVMDAFPLTPSGKVKRRALPHPRDVRPTSVTGFAAPTTEVEGRLAEIWADVLDRDAIGIHEDFFEIGGHSLYASQVIVRVREALSVELSLADVFEASTVATLAAVVEAAPRVDAGPSSHPADFVSRRPTGETTAPLSLSQRRLWLLEQLSGDSAAYNVARAFRLTGSLDVPRLQRAVDAVVERQEGLRTTFQLRDGEPVQVVAAGMPAPLQVEDLTEAPAGEREARTRRLLDDVVRSPFDLEAGPLLRVVLVHETADQAVLLVMMHHLVSDDWSIQVFLKELSALYAADDGPGALPALPYQYVDHAAWLAGRQQDDRVGGQLDYWRQQLDGASFEVDLPRDRAPSANRPHEGRIEAVHLDPEVTAELVNLGLECGTTLFMTLLGVFTALLSRYDRRGELVVGTPIANRNPADAEGLIGFFVNTLALRLRNDPRLTFRELLGHVREVSLGAYSNPDVPFDRVVQGLDRDRGRGAGSLFQAMFVLQNVPKEELVLPGVRTRWIDLDKPTAGSTFDLMLSLTEVGGELRGALEYDAGLFDEESVRRLADQFVTLAKAVCEDADRPAADVELMTEDERGLVLGEWAGAATDYPRDRSVPALFEEQCAATPDAVAAEFGDRRISYAELERRANRLAHHLVDLGVRPGTRVGICVERDLDMLPGFLGILKAGGAYVPLDPTYPTPRLAYMIEDTGCTVVVTEERARAALPDGVRQVSLDGDRDALESRPDTPPDVHVPADAPAYVIYTSGSTGRPKGVCVEHRSIVRLVRVTDYVDLQPDDRIAQASTLSFDAATFELWGALLNGACLVGVPKDVALQPELMADALRDRGITTMFVTTALFNQLVGRRSDVFGTLRTVMFGGEAVDPRRVRTVLEEGPPERLLHVYGPTENTTFSTWHRVEHVAPDAHTVPIGRAIANSTVYVLDDDRRPVPVGAPGTLYVGGDGVASGYLNDESLTAERFVPDPFAGSGRMYDTGDRVRWLRDGTIEFLGRDDGQVKVRGFRIELHEIELALTAHPAVRDSVVVVHAGERQELNRLVAYVVPGSGDLPGAAELRAFLRKDLPEYMVPSVYVALDEVPLSPNGKIDKAALPAPHDRQLEGEAVAPRTETESRVAAIWRELLEIDEVSIHDDFFELGGHSLLGMQLVSRLRDEFDLGVPLQLLFDEPTVAGLGAGLEAAMAVQQDGADSEEDDDRVEIDF